ncbi:ThuA domain-containing protein [Deinococcus peraridilitoris]|uniref:ThuA-like domain-containing protein n=1 Tax=Deinococcus peraridilitoris (strain DSM 19664 / LMG 22246 / CIP 109416 / KR-200) TaxID=937777 RepID=L0A338_DEIPD|nr:ThuA domain-containing protein [Deinococcus peraridilitoris]AFZ68256.1 hypothetical protein Deipe_2792 [Deinococcus peraridilitoris DSM 19664]
MFDSLHPRSTGKTPGTTQKASGLLMLSLLLAGCGPQGNSAVANPPTSGSRPPVVDEPVICTPSGDLPRVSAATGTPGSNFDVLVFVKNSGCRLDAVKAGVKAIEQLGAENSFTVNATDDAGIFTEQGLAAYEAVVFLNTSGDVLNPDQQRVFEKFIRSGKGFVGVHAAAETELNWPWYGALVGAYFSGKPKVQTGNVQVVNRTHASTQGLPDSLSLNEGWHSFRELQGNVVPLLNLDESSVAEIPRMGAHHPVSWYQFYDNGRSFYTGLGHTSESYADASFRKHLLGGIKWAATGGQPGAVSWGIMEKAPIARWESQGLGAEGKLFVFGGDKNGVVPVEATAETYAFDPRSNSWSRLKDMPELVHHAGQALDGRTVWIAGGFVGSTGIGGGVSTTANVWKYDIASDTWTAGPKLPAPRGGGALVRLDRELHFFGGAIRTQKEYRDFPTHWVLNLDNQGAGWKENVQPYPNNVNHMAGAALNGKIYGVGGQKDSQETGGNTASVNVYDPKTGAWTPVSSMPRALAHVAASTFTRGGRLVVVAGVTNVGTGDGSKGGTDVANVIEYDPIDDKWRELSPLPAPRQSPVAAIVNGQIIVSGGDYLQQPYDTTWISK